MRLNTLKCNNQKWRKVITWQSFLITQTHICPLKPLSHLPPGYKKNFSEIFSIDDPNLLLKNQEQVQNEIHNFYQQLYTRVPTTRNLTQFVNFPMKWVTPEENIKLEEPIKMQEIAEFITTLSPNKALCITGSTSAFYTTFWTKIR